MRQIPLDTKPTMVEDLRKIPMYTRQYVQNRSVGMLISLIFNVATFGGIFGASYFLGVAYRSGDALLMMFSGATLLVALAGCVWLSVPKWGGQRINQLASQYYATEGDVGLETSHQVSRASVGALAGFLLVGVVLIVVLGMVEVLSTRLLQPASALFVVPFLIGLWLLMRPRVGSAALLWPTLYALHAIAILAGIPIAFERPWDWLNMLVPTAGYGILSGLVAHWIGQSALRKLKKLAFVASANVEKETDDL